MHGLPRTKNSGTTRTDDGARDALRQSRADRSLGLDPRHADGEDVAGRSTHAAYSWPSFQIQTNAPCRFPYQFMAGAVEPQETL